MRTNKKLKDRCNVLEEIVVSISKIYNSNETTEDQKN
jgi:hypothetical protein